MILRLLCIWLVFYSLLPVTVAVFCCRQIFIKCWTKRKQKEWITYLKDVASNQGEWSHLLFEHYRKYGGSSLLCVWKQQCCHHTVAVFRSSFFFLSLSYLKSNYWNIHHCFSTFVRPRRGKFFFHKTRARSVPTNVPVNTFPIFF
jgi:hypothetical protein